VGGTTPAASERVTGVSVTHIGGPTALIAVVGRRLLTDPTFRRPSRRYTFGWDTSSRKLTGPTIAAAELPAIDAVLLSHDHQGSLQAFFDPAPTLLGMVEPIV
jgi:L-ascorbate metabolism protein UlaG (beta-lactamase superfamily)